MANLLSDKQYVAKAGQVCPKCGGNKLNADDLEQDGREAYQNIDCQTCGAYWTDIYRLVGYDNFNECDIEVTQ